MHASFQGRTDVQTVESEASEVNQCPRALEATPRKELPGDQALNDLMEAIASRVIAWLEVWTEHSVDQPVGSWAAGQCGTGTGVYGPERRDTLERM
jgi:hypothetical protein